MQTENIIKTISNIIAKLECSNVYLEPDYTREIISDTKIALARLSDNIERGIDSSVLVCEEIDFRGENLSETLDQVKKQLSFHKKRIQQTLQSTSLIEGTMDVMVRDLQKIEKNIQRIQTTVDAHSQRIYNLEKQ